jgi:vacuolar-type H+-ATPase subunit I/STV1
MGFFDDNDKPLEPQEDKVVEEKIKIGEEEFSQDELKDLIGKGKFAKEVEEKYNTKLDKVWPEYTRTTQELKALKEEKEEWQRQQSSLKPQSELTEDETIQQAKEQARKLGLLTVDDVNEKVNAYVEQREKAKEILNTCSKLEGEFDGKDGRPKFETQSMLEFMRDEGIKDPAKAYKLKYENEIDQWKDQQIAGAKKKGIYTEGGSGGNKEPPVVKLNKDNLMEALTESLYSSKEE